jgi:hypothetical protein
MGFLSREPALTAEERARQQEQTHAERMKLIEMGRPLPEVEVAQAKAAEVQARLETVRANALVTFTALGPAAVIGIATGATSAVLALTAPSIHLVLVIVIWLCATVVSVATVAGLWARSQRPDVVRLLREYLGKRAKADPPPEGQKGDGLLDLTGLTPADVERLSRAIQP